ncbi:MAG: succinylglutamate desuccinylase/aspartoacylase family protein [bacterium]
MKTKDYYKELSGLLAGRKVIVVKSFSLAYKNKKSVFYRVASKNIFSDDRVILIRAGIHGDEISGPLTFLHHINEILDYIHVHGLKVIIYPLGNPTGFESGRRYNIDNDRGVSGNNDFLRYELADGKLTDDLRSKNEFKKWYWSSDSKLRIKLPKETRLMHRLLKKDPLKQIVACLDLHQDYITPVKKAHAYSYAYGDFLTQADIIKKVNKVVPVWKNTKICAGFNMSINSLGKAVQCSLTNESMRSDKNGNIIRFDGVLTDLLYRLGVKCAVTVETTGATPLDKAEKVNLLWIFGVVDFLTK